jgi:hypothetical protein
LPGRTDYSRHLLLLHKNVTSFVAVILHGMSGWCQWNPLQPLT